MPVYLVDYKKPGAAEATSINVIAKSLDEALTTFRSKHATDSVLGVQDAGLYIRAKTPAEPTHVSKDGKVLRVKGLKNGTIRALLGKYPSSLGIHSALKAEATRRGVRV